MSIDLRARLFVLAGTATALVLASRVANACGVSGPDGASLCMLAQGIGPKWRASVSGIASSTRLSFAGGDLKGKETRGGVIGSLGYQVAKDLSLQLGLGASFGGSFEAPDGSHTFRPGLLGLVGASYRLYGGPELDEEGEGRERNPFVLLTAALSFNLTSTTHREALAPIDTRTAYDAFDLRLGVLVGVTVAERFRPYALARVFGGPVYWHYQGAAITGTDTHHYQLGAGLSVALGKGFAFYAEGVPLGEQGVSGGVSLGF